MKIIIIGLGRTGQLLISSLADENYDIIVIDKEKKLVDDITDKYSVNGVVGSGASRETLLAAGAATADAIIALTAVDEINLISCMQAKNLGTRYAAARIMMPDYVGEAEFLKKEYHIDFFVKPKLDAAEEIYQNVGMPGFAKLEGFWSDEIRLMDLNVLEDSPLCGRTLSEIRMAKKLDMLVAAVVRKGKLHIPDGSFCIEAGDNITVVLSRRTITETLAEIGLIRKKAKKVVLIGGTIVCQYLINLLEKDKCDITVLESDPARCRELMELYPKCKILYAAGDILEVLEEENVDRADMVVSLSDNDETNLVNSLYAWSCHIPSILTYVTSPKHVRLLHRVNIDITVSPVEASALKAMRFLRDHEDEMRENGIGKFYLVAEGQAEIMELHARADFRRLGVAFKEKEFKLKKNVIIAGILRGKEHIIPSGNTAIREGDSVIVAVPRRMKIRHLNEILAGGI